MHLYLSADCPWNTTYTTEEGQVIYKTESSFHLEARPITIKRIIPPKVDGNTDNEDALRDSFSDLAEIDYSRIRTSRIRYNGIDMDRSEFLRKGEGSLLGRIRVFKGPDGKEYEWYLGIRTCKLYLRDASEALVASYHRRKLGVLAEARPASLEIFSQGLHMIDLILATFVFVEKVRTNKQRRIRGQ